MLEFLAILLVALAWVGHAYVLTALLNYVYAHDLPKSVLKPWRYATGVLILAFPLFVFALGSATAVNIGPTEESNRDVWGVRLVAYGIAGLYFGMVFPVVTLERYLRKPPVCVVSEQTRTLDLWPELGHKLIGDGKGRAVTRLPGNGVFKFDITDLALALPNLPPEWDGLT